MTVQYTTSCFIYMEIRSANLPILLRDSPGSSLNNITIYRKFTMIKHIDNGRGTG